MSDDVTERLYVAFDLVLRFVVVEGMPRIKAPTNVVSIAQVACIDHVLVDLVRDDQPLLVKPHERVLILQSHAKRYKVLVHLRERVPFCIFAPEAFMRPEHGVLHLQL